MKFLRQTLAIAAKDLRSEIRGKEAVNSFGVLCTRDPAAF